MTNEEIATRHLELARQRCLARNTASPEEVRQLTVGLRQLEETCAHEKKVEHTFARDSVNGRFHKGDTIAFCAFCRKLLKKNDSES